jgi:hypothetical protein
MVKGSGRSRFCPAAHAHAVKAAIRHGSYNTKTRRSISSLPRVG